LVGGAGENIETAHHVLTISRRPRVAGHNERPTGDAIRMSRVPVDVNRDDGEDSRRQQLLAVHELRGGVERVAPAEQKTRSLPVAVTTTELRRNLEELLAALDRRTPHIERAGEAAIVRAADALREEALRRLATLDNETSDNETSDNETSRPSDADDGRA
jgi:hypothetical protein